jgi:hypothetical protein
LGAQKIAPFSIECRLGLAAVELLASSSNAQSSRTQRSRDGRFAPVNGRAGSRFSTAKKCHL